MIGAFFKGFVHVGAPVATLLGVVVSAWGTYRLTKWYHPFKGASFWVSVGKVCWLILTQQTIQAKRKIKLQTELADPENRADSLLGLYFVFVGFVLQGLGGFFWCLDSLADFYLAGK